MTTPTTHPTPTDHEQRLDRIMGRRLISIRERAEMSLEDLSVLSGITRDELAEHETGEIPIPLCRLRAIALALDTNPSDLLARLLFPLC